MVAWRILLLVELITTTAKDNWLKTTRAMDNSKTRKYVEKTNRKNKKIKITKKTKKEKTKTVKQKTINKSRTQQISASRILSFTNEYYRKSATTIRSWQKIGVFCPPIIS